MRARRAAWRRAREGRLLASLTLPEHVVGRRGYIRYKERVTKQFYDVVCAACPPLRQLGPYALFLVYLIRAALRKNDGVLGVLKDPVAAPAYLLADMEGVLKRARQGNFSSLRFLQGFQETVREGSGGAIRVGFSDYRAGSHCTHVLFLVVPEFVREAAMRDRDAGIAAPLVEIRTGKPATSRAARRVAEKKAEGFLKEAEARSDVPDLAVRLLAYLVLTVPLRPFTALLKPEWIMGVEAFITAEYAREPKSRRYAVSVCQEILLNPKPLYHATARSVRLSPYGMNLATLQSKVRQFWTGLVGWIELDLANSQLAINAVRWNVEGVIDTLRDPAYSVWPDLIEHLGGDVADLRARGLYKPVKAALKVIVYGVCFGMGLKNLRRFGGARAKKVLEHRRVIEQVFGMTHKEAGKRLLKHPVIAALLQARDVQIERVMAAGGLTDCFGRWIRVEGRTVNARRAAARSALAQAAQAEEMALLGPVIEAAIEEAKKAEERTKKGKRGRPVWRIVLWQHDGFSIWLKEARHRDAVVRDLQRLVAEEAERRGIPTRLEVA